MSKFRHSANLLTCLILLLIEFWITDAWLHYGINDTEACVKMCNVLLDTLYMPSEYHLGWTLFSDSPVLFWGDSPIFRPPFLYELFTSSKLRFSYHSAFSASHVLTSSLQCIIITLLTLLNNSSDWVMQIICSDFIFLNYGLYFPVFAWLMIFITLNILSIKPPWR